MRHLAWLVAAWCVGCAGGDPSGEVRGRVVLEDRPGLGDMSRVVVNLAPRGRSTAPGEDGTFVFGKLAAGTYEVSVIYSGVSGTTGSPYRTATRQARVDGEGSVDVGDIVLERAAGSVTGRVVLADSMDPDGTQVLLNLESGATVLATVAAGSFSFTDVPVGQHALGFSRAGYVLQGACSEPVVINAGGEVADVGTQTLAPLAVSLAPGGFSVATTDGNTWFTSSTTVTVIATTAAYTQGRAWVEPSLPPAWAPLGDSFTFDALAEGTHRVHLQFRDGCGNESDVFDLDLVRDTQAPTIQSVTIGDGSGVITTAVQTITLTATGATQMAAAESADLSAVPWTQYSESFAFTFSSGSGQKTLHVRVRDQAGNVSASAMASATLN